MTKIINTSASADMIVTEILKSTTLKPGEEVELDPATTIIKIETIEA